MKWIKEYGWVLPVLLLVFSLAVAGSFAAYVNYNSAKKVVATGETTKVFFSSNYLYPVNQSETSYRLRRILPTMTADGTGYTFTVQICNYVYGNREQVNEKDITYHLIVSLRAADGGELPENSGSVTVNQTEIGNTGQVTTEDTTLPGKQAKMDSYTIFIPKKLRDTIRIEIVAEPDNASYAAVGNQKLAVILTIAEQKMVSDYVVRTLSRFAGRVEVGEPYTVRAGNLLHLRSDFSFSMAEDGTYGIGDIVDALHPTPAVCGLPKDEARTFILDNESADRSYYSGYAGPWGIKDLYALYVSLRCMEIREGRCLMHAGGGLLTDSVEEKEWEETVAKMEAMRTLVLKR